MKNQNPEDEMQNLIDKISKLENSSRKLEKIKKTSEESECALRESEKRFHQVAESAGEWIWEINAEGLYIYSSPAVEKIIGYTPLEIVGKKYFFELFHPDAREKLKKAAFKLFKKQEPFKNITISNRHKNGTTVISEVSGVPIIGEDKQLLGYRGLDNDVTDLVKLNKVLKRSQRRLNDIINHLPDATFAIDCEGKVIAWNKAIEEMTGIMANEILGKDNYEYAIPFYGTRRPILIDLIFKTDDEIEKWKYADIRKIGDSLTAESPFPKLGGKNVFLWGKASPLYDEKGKLTGAVESIRDITEHKQIENALKENQQRYKELFTHMASGVAVYSTGNDGKNFIIEEINKAGAEMTDIQKKEVKGKNVKDAYPGIIDMGLLDAFKRVYKTGKPEKYPLTLYHDKKISRWFENYIYKLDDGDIVAVFDDLSELKKNEEALIRSKKHFQDVFDNSPLGIFHTAPDGKVYEVNKALADMFHYDSIEDFISTVNKTSLQEAVYVNEEDRQQMVKGVLSDNYWHSFEIPFYTKTGSIIIVDLKARSIKNADGTLKYLEGFLEDITERKNALEKLHRSEERFRVLAESAVDGILTTDEEGKIILFNDSLLKIFGYHKEEILNKPVTLLIPDKLKDNFRNRLEKFKVTGRHALSGKTFLSTGLRKDGKEFPFEMSLATWESQGEIFTTSIIRDVTERQHAENALRESEAKFRNLVETTPEIIWDLDSQGNFTYISPQIQDILGYKPDEIIEKPFFRLVSDEDRERVKEIFINHLKGREYLFNFEVKAKNRNGSRLTIEIRSVKLTNDKGQITGFRGIARDITERKKAEEELKKANLYNRSLIEASLDPLVTIGPDGKITDVNNATESVTGYSRDDLIGTDFSDYFTEPEKARKGYEQVFNEGFVQNYPLEIKNKKGKITPVLYNASVYRDELDNVVGVFAAARDISAIKEAEDKLRGSQNKLRIAMDLANLVHWEYDVKTDQFIFDDQFYSLYGTTADQMGGAEMSSKEYAERFISPEDAHLVEDKIKDALETDDPDFRGQVEHKIIRPDGEIRYILVRFGVIKDDKGRTIKTYGANQDITERVEAERSIKDQAELLNLAHEAIFVHDLDNKILFWNEGAAKLYGWSKDEAIGKTSYQLLNTKFPEPLENIIDVMIDKGQWNGQLVHTKSDGSKIIVESRWTLKRDEKEQPISVLEINTDVTEKINFERALLESEERFQQVAESAGDWIWETDSEGLYIYSNQVVKDILGYEPNEVIGQKHIYDFATPEDQQDLKKTAHELLTKKAPFHGVVYDRLHKNGSRVKLETNGVPHEDDEGNFSGYRGVHIDITQREQAVEALRESEKKYRDLAELLPQTVFETDDKGNFTFANRVAFETFGYSQEDLDKGLNIVELLVPEDHKRALEDVAMVFGGKNLGAMEYTALRRDGSKLPVLTYTDAILHKDMPVGLRGVLIDLTDYKKAEEELRKSENKYRSLYSSMNEGVAIHEIIFNEEGEAVDYKIIDVNPSYERIIGFSKKEVVGKKAFEIYGTLGWQLLDYYSSVALSGEAAQFETYFEIIDKYFSISVTSPSEGRFVTVFEDITRRKKAEDEIITSLKQKEILLQEIHHRVKNNLQIISSLLNLQESYVEDKEAVNVLRESQNRVLSMAMIHEMLYDSEDLSTIDFSGYIHHLIYDLFNSYGIKTDFVELSINVEDIHLNIETAVPCGLIISELVSNSLKYAFPEGVGGILSIDFHVININEFELIIEDNGVGLSENIDFKSTDSLGLRLVNSLVDQLDGTIELDRSRGTKFIIKFTELEYRKRI